MGTFNAISSSDIRETIQLNLSQAKAIITCIMFSIEFLQGDVDAFYHALLAVDNKLKKLQENLNNLSI